MPLMFRPRHHRDRERRSQGQSLVEFALIVPVLLLLLLLTVDFGRLFYSWITVHNAARVAANFAGLNPYGDFASTTGDYQQLTKNESLNAVCPITSAGSPVFADTANDTNVTARDLGDQVSVSVSCSFGFLTPIISNVTGNPIPIGATSTFTVRVGPAQP
jgi:Flp pilus assembly protein TadG